MDTLNLYEAKTKLSELVERAAAGEEIIIAKAGKPMAKLVPIQRRMEPRKFGQLAGQGFWISENFNDPLPEDLQARFEGRGE